MPDLYVDEDRRLDAERLTSLLAVRHPDVEVAAVEVLGDSEGSASRLQLRLTYQPGADAGLPERLFLKRNLARFNFPTEMYSTEVRMYRDVLPGLGVESPTIYAIDTADDGVGFTILMEDLSQRPGARLGLVLDPTTPEEVDSVLATLARLHSSFWGSDELDRRVPWATAPADNAAMRFWGEIGPRLTRRHLERGHRAALVDDSSWPEAELWSGFARLLEVDGAGPHALLHGDVHAGNVYYVDGGRSPGGLLDWQLSLRGCWALDVTYLLITALSVEDRREHERELLASYAARLAAFGVDPPSADEMWLRYRQNVLYGVLMWLITPDGVHTDDAQLLNLRRCLRAAEDLETAASLR